MEQENRIYVSCSKLYKWNSFFKNGPLRPLFVYFRSFQTQIFTEKNVGVIGTRTQIVEVECEHTDHLTTTLQTNGTLWKKPSYETKSSTKPII